ncbi:MAG: response regulator transcription factor [Pseudomonadota bacterium]
MRIALLEDDADQATLIAAWLCQAGYTVQHYGDASQFLRAVRRDSFDLYILDWVLPDLSGIEVLKRLRERMGDKTPVIVATAKHDEQSVVRGLESGADDYLAKPIRQAELIARVAAVLRRAAGSRQSDTFMEMAPYTLSHSDQSVLLHGNPVKLTKREFDLAWFLFLNTGKMLSRRHILDTIWGIDNQSISTRTVDTHISRLRTKLVLREENGWQLSAIYQHGYRLEKLGS